LGDLAATLKIALRASLAVLALLLLSCNSAAAEPISTAIVGIGALIGSGVAAVAAAPVIGGLIVSTAIGVGLSVVAGLITKSPAEQGGGGAGPSEEKGAQVSVSIGGDVPRSAIYGQQATAGHFVYFNAFGTNNEFLQLVYVLSDGLCDALAGLEVDGKPVTLGTAGTYGTIINEFVEAGNPRMWVQFHDGAFDQGADANLVSNANPAGRWSPDDKLTNLCYVVVTLGFSDTLFTGGLPSFLFIIRGLRLYDFRKDSTSGGSGSHIWGQPSTYEWTDNPAVGLYNYQRGLFASAELLIGQGLSPLDFVLSAYTAAANACDESVPHLTGTEKRYRIGMQVSNGRQHREVIQDFLTAMAGTMTESAGAFAPHAGVVQLAAVAITDAELVSGYPVRYAAKRSRAELVNAIFGTYSDPTQGWRSIAFPPRTSSADESADAGERLAGNRDYPMIFSPTQAQRIGEIERRLARFQATATITLPFQYVVLEPGDWIDWTSTRFTGVSSTTRKFQISATTVGEDRTVTLSLRQIDPTVFSWTPVGDQLDPQHPGDLPGIGVEISTIAGLTVSDVTLTGASGTKTPGLRCQWVPVTDRRVYAVIFQYRIVGSLDTHEAISDQPSFGEYIITTAIQPASLYEVRATIRSEPPRIYTFTAFVQETAPSDQVVLQAIATGAVAAINWESFENDIRVQLEEAVANVAAVHEIGSAVMNKWVKWKERSDILHSDVQVVEATATNSLARIIREEIVRAEEDFALVQVTEAMQVQVDDNSAAIVNEQTVRANADSAIASDVTTLETSVDNNTANITVLTSSVDGIEVKFGVTGTINGVTGGFLFTGAQRLGDTPIFAVEIDGNLIVNGTIVGAKIAALAIDTLQLNARAVNANKIAINGVEIDNILQGAATATASASHSSPGTVTTERTIVSVVLTITSGVAEIFYQCDQMSFGTGNTGQLKLYIDGVVQRIYTFTSTNPASITHAANGLSAGDHTFAINGVGITTMQMQGGGHIKVNELRK
jgi:Putative phage tail protein